jgi:hypothetical protein
VSFANLQVKSKGGKDIFLVKISDGGKILGYQHYGTVGDETITQIHRNNENIVFGGEIGGLGTYKKIGNIDFTCLNFVEHEAYMSYMTDKEWIVEGSIFAESKIKKDNTQYEVSYIKDGVDIKVYPNPFTNNLNISINCNEICDYEVSLINTLGAPIWKKIINASKGNTNFQIDSAESLENGIYFLEIRNSKNKIAIYRVIKN